MKMRNERPARRSRKAASNRALLVLTGIVLFAGLFAQVTMLARISSQSKRASSLEGEIEELTANAENLELSINRYHNLDSIAVRARQLGMEQPSEGQIRVISVARSGAGSMTAQAAGNASGENIQN